MNSYDKLCRWCSRRKITYWWKSQFTCTNKRVYANVRHFLLIENMFKEKSSYSMHR